MEDVPDRFLYMLAGTLIVRLFTQLIRYTRVEPTLSLEIFEIVTHLFAAVLFTSVMLIIIYVGIVFISFFVDLFVVFSLIY
jgi:hypothetical protein